jgi:hypothetical protein
MTHSESEEDDGKHTKAEKTPQEVARLAQATLDQMEDLDTFLDLVMIDQAMSIAKAKKAGDVVVLVACHMRITKYVSLKAAGSSW